MSTALTLRPSCAMADRRHAARPATCGAAMLVPPLISSPVFQRGTDENATPGATRSGLASSAPRELHRSEEHTSELQSQSNLVCRLLLEKKKKEKNASTVSVELRCVHTLA